MPRPAWGDTFRGVSNGFFVSGDQLRAAVTDLRNAMLPDLESAHNRLLEHFGAEILGPTAAPAQWEFQEAWRAELKATIAAVQQLAETLERTAGEYDELDRLTGEKYRSVTK
jgi:hypothetical protein